MLRREVLRPAALFLIVAVASSCGGGGGGYASPTAPARTEPPLVAAHGFEIVTLPLAGGGEIQLAVTEIQPQSGGTVTSCCGGHLIVGITKPSDVSLFMAIGFIPAEPLETCPQNFYCEPGPGFENLPWSRSSFGPVLNATAATPDVVGAMIGVWAYRGAGAPGIFEGPPHFTVVQSFTWLTL